MNLLKKLIQGAQPLSMGSADSLSATASVDNPELAAANLKPVREAPAAIGVPPEKDDWRALKLKTFEQKHGFVPNLENPRRFSEKLLKRILEDDDPHYRVYGVKLFAHYFVTSKSIDGLKVPRHLKVVNRLTPDVFDDLPDSFVIKSSFASGLNEIVLRKSDFDSLAVMQKFNDQIHRMRNAQYALDENNVVIFEEFLGDPTIGTPDDYKFHCFNKTDGSTTVLVQVDSDRFDDHRQTIFTEDYVPTDLRFADKIPHETIPQKPAALEEMIRIAKELSVGFDYVRIDLFNVGDDVYFGEITPFHNGGMAPVHPIEWDEKLGRYWDQRFPSYQPSA